MAFNCTACELHKTKGRCYVQGIGAVNPGGVFIIGEHPTKADSATGTPFMGLSKDVLAALLKRIGLTRTQGNTQVFTSNLVQCAPPLDDKHLHVKPTDEQLEACWKNLEAELAAVKPKVILLLGAAPAKLFLGARTLTSVAGRVYDSADCRGISYALSGETKKVTRGKARLDIPLNRPEEFKVIATWAPGAALRDPSLLNSIERTFDTVGELLGGKAAQKPNYDYHCAHTEPEAFAMLNTVLSRVVTTYTMEPEGALGFDIETSGFNWYRKMFGSGHVATTQSIAFSVRENEVFSLLLRPHCRSPRVLDVLKQVLEHPIRKVGHNGKFDNVFLRGELGIDVKNYTFDTMVAAYHMDQEALLGLGALSPVYRPDLGYYWEDIERKWLNREADGKRKNEELGYLNAPADILLEYNARDVDVTMTLYRVYKEKLKEWGAIRPFTEISMPHLLVLQGMEYEGVKLDVPRCIEMGKAMVLKMRALEVEALATVNRHPHWWGQRSVEHGIAAEVYKPFNIASGKQLGELLFTELKLPVQGRTEKGALSITAETLKALKDAHPIVPKLLEYRKTQKYLSTYLGWELREDGTEGPMTTGGSLLAVVGADSRVRPNFKITGTGTARLSCADPNLQNQPKTKEFRDLFVAEDDSVFIDSDFSALELRIVAILANDEAMIDIFKKGIDPHSATASKMFGIPIEQVAKDGKQRKAAKAINFGIVYGEGAAALAASLGVSKQEAEKWLEDWGKAYPGVTRFIAAKHAEVRKCGYVSYSMNRRRPLPDIFSSDKGVQGGAERASVNTPVQGTGADCNSTTAIRIAARFARELPGNAKVILEIHDQIISEVKRGYAEQAKAIHLEEHRRPMPFLPQNLDLDADCDIKTRLGDGL